MSDIKMIKFGEPLQKLSRFMLVGGVTGLLNLALYIILRGFGVYFIIANIISVGAAILINFFWNRRWTFEHKDKIKARRQLIEYLTLNGISYVSNQILLYVGVLLLPWPIFGIPSDFIVKFILLIGLGLIKFIVSHKWIFSLAR